MRRLILTYLIDKKMKKILFTVVFAMFVGVVSAQTEKGNWLVGANLANINYDFDFKEFSLELTPQAGYFIADDVAVGALLNLGVNAPEGGDAETFWGIGPFVRGYFGGTEKGKFFGQADLAFGGYESETRFGLGATAGYAYFLTKNVALETGLGYDYYKWEGSDGASNLGLNVGFQIYLSGKK